MSVKSSQSAAVPKPERFALRQSLAALVRTGVAPRAGRLLAETAADAAMTLRATILAEEPAFRASGNPELLPEVSHHVGSHTAEIIRLLEGGEAGDFDFVRARARTLAEQHFPLEAILQSYRSSHRVLAQWLREAGIATRPRKPDAAISAIADFAVEYTNAISTVATSEYVAHTRRLAEAQGDLRTELFGILLAGYDESDQRIAQVLKRAGYLEQRQTYCVLVAQSAQPAEMESRARAERIIAALADAITPAPIRLLAGIRDHLVVAVLSGKRRQSGWTAPQADLAHRILPRLEALGPAVLIGVSADHPSTAFIPKALSQAVIALDLASVGRRVVRYSDLALRDLLVHHGSASLAAAMPGWMAALAAADLKSQGALVETLRAVAEADLNVQAAARRLGRHPNTVYACLTRIRDLTGLDGQRYHELTELLLAADCQRG